MERKSHNVSKDVGFAKGADISLLKRNEDAGAIYTENGKPKDALQILKNHGFNYMRLRLFHTPIMKGSQVNDLPYTLELARRIKACGFRFLLNFHYSDGWADPQKQHPPAAWKGLSHGALVNQVFEYTRDVVATFREHDGLPDMAQIGNEITPGMLWEDGRVGGSDFEIAAARWTTPAGDSAFAQEQWKKLAELVRAGIRGVETGAGPDTVVQTMIHVDRGGDQRVCKWFFDNLFSQGVEFDVIGLSYYPFWHGTFDDLRANLEFVAEEYEKDIIVVETGFPWKPQPLPDPADFTKRLSVAESEKALPYPMSPEGQRAFLEELIQIVRDVPDGRGSGVFYWAPEHTEVKGWEGPDEPDAAEWYPRALFHEDGEMTLGMQAFEE
jgi:arabinogalactan endo-1,4-beta-galactosidase